MSAESTLLKQMAEKLDAAGIPYMVSGSVASSVWSTPRLSYDIDIVIAPTAEQLHAFLKSVGERLYVNAEAAEEALRTRGMFNVIAPQAGMKVDLIIRKDRPFSAEEFARRRPGRIGDADVLIISPEGSILSKLEWSKLGDSDRQFDDALRVAKAQRDELDLDYLRRWGKDLGVSDLLERLLGEVES